MPKQASKEVTLGDSLNEAVHRRVVTCKGREPIWRTSRNDQINLRVELIAPESSRPERLILQFRTKVVQEASGEDEDARGAPSEWNDGRSLVRRVVNSSNQDLASEHKGLRLPLDLVELSRALVRMPERGLNESHLSTQEPDIAIQPESGRFIESRVHLERCRSLWGCKVRCHPRTVSNDALGRESRCIRATTFHVGSHP